MNITESEVRQALEALKIAVLQNGCYMVLTGEEFRKCESAIATLKEALARPSGEDAARLDWLEQATWLNFSRLGCEHKVMTGSKLRWHIDRTIATKATTREKP